MTKAELVLQFLDNSQGPENWREMGILKFAKHFFPHIFYNDFAFLHYRVLKEILWLYHPNTNNRLDRRRYVVVHREAAKTTIVTKLWPLVCVWLKGLPLLVRYDYEDGTHEVLRLPPLDESLILIASETSRRSEGFVMDIKSEVDGNDELRRVFGEKNPQFVDLGDDDDDSSKRRKDGIWRQNAFLTSDGTAVWGLGAGQQTRGIQVRNRRPTLAIVDDMYSKKNIKTDTMRETMNYWFEAEFQNTVDTQVGKSLFAGTVLHPDTVAARLPTMSSWTGVNIPIIQYSELKPILNEYCRWEDNRFILPDKATMDRLNANLKTLSWPERYDLRYVLQLYADCAEQHKLGYFYQEYLNMTTAPEEQKFTWESFKRITPKYSMYQGQRYMSFEYDDTTWYAVPNFCIGADFASSESEVADETVLTVGAMLRCISKVDSNGKSKQMIVPFIAHIEGGRGWGVYTDNGRPGVVSRIKHLANTYRVSTITADANATQELIVRETERTIRDLPFPVVVYHHKGTGKKTDFILSVLEPVFQQHDVCLYDGNSVPLVKRMYDQLIVMNGKGHDDYPDSLAMMFYNARANMSYPLLPDVASTSKASPDGIKLAAGKLSAKERWEVL